MMIKTGVYIITNSITGKVYIGSTSVSFGSRWASHKSRLRRGAHYNSYLQAAWDKYGESNFQFEVLEYCTYSEATIKEQYWIDFYQACKRSLGYNIMAKVGVIPDMLKCKLPIFVFKINGERIGKYSSPSHIAHSLFNDRSKNKLVSGCLAKDKLSYQGYVFSYIDVFPGYNKKKNPGRGKWNAVSKAKLSKTRTGIKQPNISTGKLGKSNTAIKKAVEQWQNDKLIQSWPSAKDASDALGILKTNIGLAAQGKRPSAGGYNWTFKI